MGTKRKKSRIYPRERYGATRYYADFRDFADVGGSREALIPHGMTKATDDPEVAEKLTNQRLDELQELRRYKGLYGTTRVTLHEFAAHHLKEKVRAGKYSKSWLKQAKRQLEIAIEFFGGERDLASITTAEVQSFANHLRSSPNGRGGTLSGGTVRHHLNTVSNLFRRAASEGHVSPGYNPVASLLEKPTAGRREAKWLEVPDAALLLESARTWDGQEEPGNNPLYPLLATFLLTGGRWSEVRGLEVGDVSFDRKTVTFRPNRWRGLKTSTSHRTVPLWPQLEEILGPYIRGSRQAVGGALLFPSARGRGERMITDTRKALDAVAVRAGWKAGEIRTKMFRHTFAAARLQTLDRGVPVSPWTVSRELGHGGTALVDRVYGHLGSTHHRSETVEYRIEKHVLELDARLKALSKAAG